MKLVINLRTNVKKRVNIAEVASGLNVRRIIEKAVFDELCSMLDGCDFLPSDDKAAGCSIRWIVPRDQK